MSEIDLTGIRARLASSEGKTFWRSLDELADTAEFRALLENEFPSLADEFVDSVGRRRFLKLMGASLALAGVGACTRQPQEPIVPYVKPPEAMVPGRPMFFATAMTLGGMATGVLVESHMGRPTKIEGNPNHPASLGATDAFAQAAVLGLYDPDRSQTLTLRQEVRPWTSFVAAMQSGLTAQRGRQGEGLRILTETVTSPTLAATIRSVLADMPKARWHQFDPVGRDHVRAGARAAFGRIVETQYHLDRADVVVSLDSDVLASGPSSLRHAREFAARRRVSESNRSMPRLYAIESTPTLTGAMADHRVPVRSSQIGSVADALAAAVGVAGAVSTETPVPAGLLTALVTDLRQHQGRSLVVAGDGQDARVHALAHHINHALGNVGQTVNYTEPVEAEPTDQLGSLRELVDAMETGGVQLLLILGGNPVYSAPADLRFRERLVKVPQSVHLGLYQDETAEWCHWHVPEAHFLETWGDARAFDGTATICQPLIAPLHGGKSALEVLATITGEPDRSAHDIVQAHWRQTYTGGAETFDRFWRRSLHDGLVADTALPSITPQLSTTLPAAVERPSSSGNLEINFRPDPTVYDGRFSNNGWLQELPKPLTSLTWDNAALVSPRTAERLSVHSQQVVELRRDGRTVRAPLRVMEGHPDDVVTVHLGYGRRSGGRAATGAGFDAYVLRTSDALWSGTGLELRATGDNWALAATQLHHNMEGRHPVRATTIAEYLAHPELIHEMGHEPPPTLTMFPPFEYDGYKWGMAIDLNSCTGCNACIVACQAENNIPVVGKEQVIAGREMHWIRVDRYYAGDNLENPEVYHQPLPCMHCENAPCEVVCPVAATVHSAEGLNEMVYNRCVGTRYCSNNCPYKVRRFNFLLYNDFETPTLKMARNPDVTVRTRGVMEKCTYCVQRINAARIDSEREGRSIRDGEVVTACQSVCPAEAIVFGNINDPGSRVSRLKADHRNYGLLADLNTRPRTTYLAALRNPNPDVRNG